MIISDLILVKFSSTAEQGVLLPKQLNAVKNIILWNRVSKLLSTNVQQICHTFHVSGPHSYYTTVEGPDF